MRIAEFLYSLRLLRLPAPLKIDDLQPISPREEEWTNLKLPHGHKKTVQALVQKHFDWKKHGSTAGDEGDEYHESDFIRGKGETWLQISDLRFEHWTDITRRKRSGNTSSWVPGRWENSNSWSVVQRKTWQILLDY